MAPVADVDIVLWLRPFVKQRVHGREDNTLLEVTSRRII